MPRFLRWTFRLLVFATLLVLAASGALVVWLDRKAADPKLAGDAAAQLSEALGARVSIGALDVHWPGWLTCDRVTVRLDGDAPGAPLAEIEAVDLLFSPSSLFHRRPAFLEARIVNPRLALRLQPDGTLAVPPCFQGAAPLGTSPVVPARAGWVERFDISDAEVRLAEADGPRLLLAEGVDLRGNLRRLASGAAGEAHLGAGKVTLPNGLELVRLTSVLSLADGIAALKDVRARAGPATFEGTLSVDRQGGTPRIRFAAAAKSASRRGIGKFVDLPEFLAFDAGGAVLQGEGDLENPGAIVVTGTVSTRNTRLDVNRILKTAGVSAVFPGWDAVRLGDAAADLSHSNGCWRLANIATTAPPQAAAASGDLWFWRGGGSAGSLACTLPLGGGQVRADFNFHGATNALPYTARITLRGVGLAVFLKPFDIRLASAKGAPPLDAYLDGQGRVEADVRFTGDPHKPGGAADGAVSIEGLTLAGERLLKDAGVPADLPDLRALSFGTVTGAVTMAGREMRFRGFRSRGNSPARLGLDFALTPSGLAEAAISVDVAVLRGRFQGRLNQKPGAGRARPFGLAVDALNLDAPGLLRAFRLDPGKLEGLATVRFSGEGDLANPAGLRGAGTVAIRPARIRNVNIFTILGTMLAMPGVGSFDLDSVASGFRIAERTVHLDGVRSAPETRTHFTAQGAIGFDGAMRLKGELAINSGAPGFVGNVLYKTGLRANRGMIRVPFTVTDRANKPRVALDTPGLAGSAARSVIDNVPLVNRIPALFRKKQPPAGPEDSRK